MASVIPLEVIRWFNAIWWQSEALGSELQLRGALLNYRPPPAFHTLFGLYLLVCKNDKTNIILSEPGFSSRGPRVLRTSCGAMTQDAVWSRASLAAWHRLFWSTGKYTSMDAIYSILLLWRTHFRVSFWTSKKGPSPHFKTPSNFSLNGEDETMALQEAGGLSMLPNCLCQSHCACPGHVYCTSNIEYQPWHYMNKSGVGCVVSL